MSYRSAKMPDLSRINRGLRVLVVEDDDVYSGVLMRLLNDDKRIDSVTVARNGYEAIRELTKENWPDLVLTDLTMPKMDGFDFLRRLRQEERRLQLDVPAAFQKPFEDDELPLTPTVAMTSSDKAFDLDGVLAAEGNCFATKPRSVEDLRMLLRGIVRAVIWGEPLPLVFSAEVIRQKNAASNSEAVA